MTKMVDYDLSKMANPKVAKRVEFERKQLINNPIEGTTIINPIPNVLVLWCVTFTGQEGTPYAGGKFVL